MTRILVVFLVSLIALSASPAPNNTPPKQPAGTSGLKRSVVAAEAFEAAARDVLTCPADTHIFTRYIWFDDPSPAKIDALRLALAHISLASDIVDVHVVAGGALVRINLSEWAPQIEDLQKWIDTWELLAFDPSSAELLTKDQIAFLLTGESTDVPKVQVRRLKKGAAPAKAPGKDDKSPVEPVVDIVVPTNEVFEFGLDSPELEALRKENVVRFNGRHIDPAVFLGLQRVTQSLAPVVHYEYFLWRALTTVKDKGLFADVYGGRYYDFARVRKAQNKDKDGSRKFNDLDQLFLDLGLGNNADKLFDILRTDQRAYLDESAVTGKPRVIVFLPAPVTGEGRVPYVTFTIDLADQDIDTGNRQLLNLLKPKARAIEAFWTTNGVFKAAVFNVADNGDVNLADSVDANQVAADRTIPNPHSPVIQPVIGCVSCHCASGSNLLIPFTNELPAMLRGLRGDVFGDLGDKKRSISDTVDRLKLYVKKTDLLLTRGREDYASSVLAATFQTKVLGPKELVEIGKTVSTQMVDDYKRYRYARVTPQVALKELGFVAETEEQAVAVLKVLLPPDPDTQAFGLLIEDPFVLRLISGLSIGRTDWDLRKGYLSFLSQRALARLPKDDPMKKMAPPMKQPAPKLKVPEMGPPPREVKK